MHITPWCYPQLYLYFKLAGFSPPVLIEEPVSKPKHFHERLLGFPSKLVTFKERSGSQRAI